MAVDNESCWIHDSVNIRAPDQAVPEYTGVLPSGAGRSGVDPVGWILTAGAVLIISTNLLVGFSLLCLIRKKGGQSWCFVLNLALADMLVGVSITSIASGVINAGSSSTSRTRCLLRMALLTSTSAASILTMFLISLDRYIAIKLPLRYPSLTGVRVTAVALVTLWLLAFAVGFLPGVVQPMQQSQYGGVCTIFLVLRPDSVVLLFCLCFFPVLSIFVFFYLDILKIACAHQRQIRRVELAGSRPDHPNRPGGSLKALRTVALLVGCFTLSWSPFFITSAVQVLCCSCRLYHIIEHDLWLLGLSNSLLNPLVYACWQREVRLELCSLLTALKCKLSHATPHVTSRGGHTGHTSATVTPALAESASASGPRLKEGLDHTDAPALSSSSV